MNIFNRHNKFFLGIEKSNNIHNLDYNETFFQHVTYRGKESLYFHLVSNLVKIEISEETGW